MLGRVCGKCCFGVYVAPLLMVINFQVWKTDHLYVKITFMEEKNKFTLFFTIIPFLKNYNFSTLLNSV